MRFQRLHLANAARPRHRSSMTSKHVRTHVLGCLSLAALCATTVGPVDAAARGTVTAPPRTTHYDVVDLGTLGGTSSTPNGINDRGLVTGSSFLQGDKVQHAVLWTRGRKIDLGTLGGPNSAVNWPVKADTGEIVGASELSQTDPFAESFCSSFGTTHLCLGFRYQGGVMTPLPTLGGNNGYATSVNDRGQVVGLAETATRDSSCVAPQVFDYDAVIWGPNDQLHVLHPLAGDTVSEAIAINSAGQVVGASGPCGPTLNPAYAAHALLWQNESIIDLGTLGGNIFNAATAIDDRGQIAGISGLPGNTALHGFLWQNGVMSDLGTLPGDVNSFAFGMNNKGQVVGASCPARGHCHAVLWQDGTITDLSLLVPSRLHMFEAFDVNDRGQIVASGDSLTGGRTPAVLLIPDDGAPVAPHRGPTRNIIPPQDAAPQRPPAGA
jgi:probable HAF family extracellular repeat protein